MRLTKRYLERFQTENNAIEGIKRSRAVLRLEVEAVLRFLICPRPGTTDIIRLVAVMQPYARMRNRIGDDVVVGSHVAPKGGPHMVREVADFLIALYESKNPSLAHAAYLHLHPFTDGNGRSARVLYLWQILRMGYEPCNETFLQHYYYTDLRMMDHVARGDWRSLMAEKKQ